MKRRLFVFSCDNLAHDKTAGGGVCDGESNAPGDVYRCDSQFGGARGGAQKRRGVGILQKISLPFFGACGILRRLECRNATGAATERLEASVETRVDSQSKSPLARFVGGYFLSPLFLRPPPSSIPAKAGISAAQPHSPKASIALFRFAENSR